MTVRVLVGGAWLEAVARVDALGWLVLLGGARRRWVADRLVLEVEVEVVAFAREDAAREAA